MSDNTDKTMVFDTPDAIEYAQLASVKQMINLQALGMKHSSGRNVKADWAQHFGLSRRAKPADVIQRIQQRMDFLLVAKSGGITAAQLKALCDYAVAHGDGWQDKLLNIPEGVHDPILKSVIDEKGEKWVKYLKLDIEVIS